MNLLAHGRDETVADETRASSQADELFTTIKNGGGMLSGLKDAAEVRVSEIIRQASWQQCQAIKVRSHRCSPLRNLVIRRQISFW